MLHIEIRTWSTMVFLRKRRFPPSIVAVFYNEIAGIVKQTHNVALQAVNTGMGPAAVPDQLVLSDEIAMQGMFAFSLRMRQP